jgi:DUF4097 and DUF4098 domain-containing protein YvlB
MKKIKILILVLAGLICSLGLNAQRSDEKISKVLSFEKKSGANAVIVANINGNIKVTGYDGDQVILEVEKTVTGKTDERLEKGKLAIQLGIIDRADTLIFYVDGGCNHFEKNEKDHHNKAGWGYHWNNCQGRNNCQEEYDYTMNFTLKIPSPVNILLSTINDGDITVENMKGGVEADNINGGIKLSNLLHEVHASTINGNVDIDYAHNPDKACRFYTLNGDINANFQKGLGARVSFESFNGNFYTNVDRLESLPVVVEKSNKGDGIRYKVNGNRYQVGSGGVDLDFETFNGDVIMKEKSN